MRNFHKMPEPHATIGPGGAESTRVTQVAEGVTGHGPSTMIILSPTGARMEPLIPVYKPHSPEYRLVRPSGHVNTSRVHKAGR